MIKNRKISAVILAAGKSLRFWPLNSNHKSLFKIMGKPLIFYLVRDLQRLGIKEVIIVQNLEKNIEKELAPFCFKNLKFVTQKKLLGTGDALLRTEKFIKNHFLLMNAERLDAQEHIKEILIKTKKSDLIILTAPTKMPHLFGILKVDGDKVLDIVEKPKASEAPSNLKNIGFYFLPQELFTYLKKMPAKPYSLIQAIALYAKKKEVKMALAKKPTLFLKFPWDLFRYERYLFDRFLENKIAASAKISKQAKIENKVQIGKNVKIYNSIISGPCYIGDNTIIDNHSILGEYSNLENNVLIGSFVKTNNSILQQASQCRQTILESSILDRNSCLGAGTVIANLRFDRGDIKTLVKGKKISTGLKSFGAVLGQNVKIGINCSLMPGVMIGKNRSLKPHSLIRENIT